MRVRSIADEFVRLISLSVRQSLTEAKRNMELAFAVTSSLTLTLSQRERERP